MRSHWQRQAATAAAKAENVLLYVVYVFYKRKLMIFHKSSDNKACSMSAERK